MQLAINVIYQEMMRLEVRLFSWKFGLSALNKHYLMEKTLDIFKAQRLRG